MVVHLDVHDIALVRPEHPQRPHVAGCLADHHVAGVAEDAGDQVQALLAPDRHDHVVGMCVDALERHHLADLLPQHRFSLPGAVLQRGDAVRRHEVPHRVGDRVQRQPGQ
jgi:hypothetical protein